MTRCVRCGSEKLEVLVAKGQGWSKRYILGCTECHNIQWSKSEPGVEETVAAANKAQAMSPILDELDQEVDRTRALVDELLCRWKGLVVRASEYRSQAPPETQDEEAKSYAASRQ